MAVRTFVTAGVAFAAAGAVAATVALAPPMSPRDVQVAKGTEVSLNALVTDPALQDLIDAYFNSGAATVVQQLLIDIVGDDGAPADLINGYFNTGISEVVRQYLAAANPTFLPGVAAINTFFNNGPNGIYDLPTDNPALSGASGLVYLRLLAAAASGDLTADQWEVIDDFFQGGLTQVTKEQLLAHFQAPVQQQFVNDLFDGGATQLAYRQFGGDFDDPDHSTTPFLSTFFNINNPFGDVDPDTNENTGVTENPGLYGASGVVYLRLLAAGLAPEQQQVVSDFFQGGASQVVETQLLSRTADPTTRALIHGFFTVGISEVIRQILVGPPVEETPDDGSGSQEARMFVANATVDPDVKPVDANPTELKPVDTGVKPVVEKKAKATPDPVEAVQPVSAPVVTTPAAPVVAAPVAPVVASPPPVVQAPEPVTPVAVKTVDADEPKDSNDVTDAMKDGNKAEVTPILIVGANGRGPKPGEGSWGVFGQVADAIGKTIAGASAPKASTGSTGSTGTDGS